MTDTSPITGPITGFDHTLIGVADLEAACETWRRLGFTTTARGRHIGWGTANYCIMFERDYIELLGIVDATQFVNGLDDQLARRGEGLLGLAFAADDVQAVHAALPPGTTAPPRGLSRLLELPEGTVEPAFKLLHFEAGAMPAVSSFVCQHLTPDLLRRPEWLEHVNGAISLEGVTTVVEDPAGLAPAYARVFGAGALREGGSRLDVRVGPHHLRFLSPARFERRYPGIAVPEHLPACHVMTVLVRDLGVTAAFLARAAIPTVPVTGARLIVPPEHASGLVLEFAAG